MLNNVLIYRETTATSLPSASASVSCFASEHKALPFSKIVHAVYASSFPNVRRGLGLPRIVPPSFI